MILNKTSITREEASQRANRPKEKAHTYTWPAASKSPVLPAQSDWDRQPWETTVAVEEGQVRHTPPEKCKLRLGRAQTLPSIVRLQAQ